ncbi:hypothetical protein [Winogradskyella bathintestinalis]|uniref:Uncharacterized protein n=1 Tax=Winogradskyella bathintestinalis TaxID=3035208 RepID=A0ABT7ZT16_9FLAO|nr:hypothetical protein [Winogradskyella bathintestinalis]MDN3492104.1 hypothetical protein [Winogradskyella bathintestinalis]
MRPLLWFSILPFLFFSSCGDGNTINLVIDNPTNMIIEMSMDSLNVDVPSMHTVNLNISKGEHRLVLANDSVIRFNFTEPTYFINPSLSNYLITEEYYGPEEYLENRNTKIPKQEVSFSGITLNGNYKIISNVINNVNWDYGPRELLPKALEINDDIAYTSAIKVFDAKEFINYINSKR